MYMQAIGGCQGAREVSDQTLARVGPSHCSFSRALGDRLRLCSCALRSDTSTQFGAENGVQPPPAGSISVSPILSLHRPGWGMWVGPASRCSSMYSTTARSLARGSVLYRL